MKFSPEGRELLSGSEDGSVRIHDTATGEEKLAFYGLTAQVVDVDICADGKLTAITFDGFTQVWDRQISSAAALLPKVVTAVEPMAAASPAAKEAPPTAPKPALPKKPNPGLPKDADGWEDLLAQRETADIAKSGREWNLSDGKPVSPDSKLVTFPLPCQVSGISYQVRAKLRQLSNVNFLHLILPVADRMCGFEIEGGRNLGGIYTGLMVVNGKVGKDIPGVVEGELINDTEPHDLEVTVHLNSANATIAATLDTRPLYEWTGPIAALRQMKVWATTEPGALALGTYNGGWAVSEVKLKRLPPLTALPSAR